MAESVDVAKLVAAAQGKAESPAAGPVAPVAATPVVAAVAPPETPAEPVTKDGKPVFRVQLKDNFAFDIAAEDRLEAIEQYNAKCGILSTIHKHAIERVTTKTPPLPE